MPDTLGFVVLAKRPDGYEPVKIRDRDIGVVFTGPNALEQAQNAQEYCEKMRPYETYRGPNFEEIPVEYEVWKLVPVDGRTR